METGITFTFAAIFLGAAVLSSLALYARQPIIIAYIALGVALGPFGLGVVSDMELVSGAGHVGIILLLFLLGLDMKPIALWNSLRQSTLVAVISAVVFATAGYGLIHLLLQYHLNEHIKMTLNVDNLLDKSYQSHLSGVNRVNGAEVMADERLYATGQEISAAISLTW